MKKEDLKHSKLKKIMKWQRNTTQKEQTRNTEVEIKEEETGKLSEKEFRIMVGKIIKKKTLKLNRKIARIN